LWDVEWRDLTIVDRHNIPVTTFNLTTVNLADPSNYETVRQAFLTAASQAVNTAPSAVDDGYSVNEGDVLTVESTSGILANDSDADGDPLTAQQVAQPQNGTLTLNADGSFTYSPDAGFVGIDSFSYMARDGAATSGAATVTIEVTAAEQAVPDFTLTDVNPLSSSEGEGISPREYLQQVSGWYFGHST
jgi:VCBS repeat-containing protein